MQNQTEKLFKFLLTVLEGERITLEVIHQRGLSILFAHLSPCRLMALPSLQILFPQFQSILDFLSFLPKSLFSLDEFGSSSSSSIS